MLFIVLMKEKRVSAKGGGIALLQQNQFLITLQQDYGHVTSYWFRRKHLTALGGVEMRDGC